jgi:hypothetical protein
MDTSGVRTPNLSAVSMADQIVVNRSGTTSVIGTDQFATQLIGGGPMSKALAASSAGTNIATTVAGLGVGIKVNQRGEVTQDPEKGVYQWTGAAWVRVGDYNDPAALEGYFNDGLLTKTDKTTVGDDQATDGGLVVDEAGFEAARYSNEGYETPAYSVDAGPGTDFSVEDDDGNIAGAFTDAGYDTPYSRVDSGFGIGFDVSDEEGVRAEWIDEDGEQSPYHRRDAGHGTDFQVADETGASALKVDDTGAELPGFEERLPDLLQLQPASFRQPAARVVEVGGYLRLNHPAAPPNPSPFISGPATISQDTSDPAHNKRNYQCIPTTCWVPSKSPAGRWWAFWYGNYDPDTTIVPPSEFPGTFGIAAFSDDSGTTWQEAFYVVPGPLPLRVADATMVTINGRVLIRYWYAAGLIGGSKASGTVPTGIYDGYSGGYCFWLNNPAAEIGQFVFSKHKFAQAGLSYNFFQIDGEWHVPMSVYDKMASDRLSDEAGRWVWKFHPETTSFERAFDTPFEENSADWNFDERQIVQLRDGGRLLCQWRSNSGIYQSIRDESGMWSTPELWTGITPNGIATKHFLARSPSGRLVAVINHATSRSNLLVALSEDDGQTWPSQLQVQIYAAAASYQTACFDDSGNILITFDSGRGPPSASIRCCKITEQDILAGTAVPVVNIISVNPNV